MPKKGVKGSKKGNVGLKKKRKSTHGGGMNENAAKKEHVQGAVPKVEEETEENLQFEDPFEDDIEEEIVEENQEEDGDTMMDVEGSQPKEEKKKEKKQKEKKTVSFEPSVDEIGPDEKLDYDPSAYTTLHKLEFDWPCLTFDIIEDKMGAARDKFPLSFFMVAGTQADEEKENRVSLLKISNIQKTQHEDDPDDDDPTILDEEPTLEEKRFPHLGAINRLRLMPQQNQIVATWSEKGEVHIWNTAPLLSALHTPPTQPLPPRLTPIFTFTGHKSEGFAIDWSRRVPGRLVTGSNNSFIYLWNYAASQNTWSVSQASYKGHTQSVEDLQWSPTEDGVFASCSVDKTIRIWDIRVPERSQLFVAAHKADVNVIKWNKKVAHLLASGGDDNQLKVWDLRQFKSAAPSAVYNYHKGPITSVDWHPTDESVLAASSEDNSLSIWDMSLEIEEQSKEEKEKLKGTQAEHAPAQLLFLHQGQKHIKEIQFHPQIPSLIISTASDGFDVFKTCNM